MSFEAMAWAVKQDLPVKQKITLLMLANRINSDTGRCFPSIKGLAADCGMSETSVKEALRSLKESGLIIAHERRIEGVSLSNEYEIVCDDVTHEIPTPPAPHAPPPRRNTPHPPGATRPLTYKKNLSVEPDMFGDGEKCSEGVDAKDDRFDAFWDAYPKKAGKPAAKKAWAKAVKKADPEKIIAAARVYAGTDGVARGFIKYPQGWLNEERFNDPDLQPPPPRSGRNVYHQGGLEF